MDVSKNKQQWRNISLHRRANALFKKKKKKTKKEREGVVSLDDSAHMERAHKKRR